MEKYKKVLEKKESYIQFTEEELEELGWEQNQKLSVDIENGGIMIKPFVKVDLDISEWSRDVLEKIIQESCDKDISVNEVITTWLTQSMGVE
jgi:hypothetical protein